MKIPVENIYYLLCYAWNKLDEKDLVDVQADNYKYLDDLFAHVLVQGCKHLIKRGLDRSYIEVAQSYSGVKGKIDFSKSLKKNLFQKAHACCVFDEFDYNMLHNQILKSTLSLLLKINQLDSKLHQEIRKILPNFRDVDEIVLEQNLFSKAQIHRNNYFYDFLLRICKLIFLHVTIRDDGEGLKFREFGGSDQQMGHLFEEFIRNFYKLEQSEFKVKRDNIQWANDTLMQGNVSLLPKMETDISLESNERKIVIETKFYGETLSKNWGSKKIRSAHLYQLFAYLKNLETAAGHPKNSVAEGILLYPTVDDVLDEQYEITGHKIRVKTINLSQKWDQIAGDIHTLIQ